MVSDVAYVKTISMKYHPDWYVFSREEEREARPRMKR